MIRFFMSQHPLFGSYKNPVPYKVEASPYYWWWYALTLNKDYGIACENNGSGFEEVYANFGDVRYEGNKHYAFCCWWRERVNTLEKRGEFLFAEPVLPGRAVTIVEDAETATDMLADPNQLLLTIPLKAQRQHIEKRLNSILKKHLNSEAGRVVRSVKKSTALYSLSKPVLPASLKKCFELYDAKQAVVNKVGKISNFELANLVKLKVQERKKEDEINTAETYKRIVSATVSRHMRQAENMIENAAYGHFP